MYTKPITRIFFEKVNYLHTRNLALTLVRVTGGGGVATGTAFFAGGGTLFAIGGFLTIGVALLVIGVLLVAI